jgi:hypothetical protein
VIIQTPGSDRFKPLLDILNLSEILEPIILPATMGNSLPKASDVATRGEIARFGRELSQNERACAISHSRARAIIATSKEGGLVFEDDARIINLPNLEAAVIEFLSGSNPSIRALGLLEYRNADIPSGLGINQPRIHRLLAEVPLAVATVLTPSAAEVLLRSAGRNSQIADWPNSSCKFYITSPGSVLHGDTNTESVIGEASTRVYGKSHRISTKTGLLSRFRRLVQKLDTYLIRYYQSK